jgi:TRAP-type C4-dicarboxylate transport system permease small subunit
VKRFPQMTQIALNYFVQVLSILFCVILIVAATQKTLRVAAMGLTLGSLPSYPLWPGYGLVVLGICFMTLLILLDIKKVGKTESCLFKKDSGPMTTETEKNLQKELNK